MSIDCQNCLVLLDEVVRRANMSRCPNVGDLYLFTALANVIKSVNVAPHDFFQIKDVAFGVLNDAIIQKGGANWTGELASSMYFVTANILPRKLLLSPDRYKNA